MSILSDDVVRAVWPASVSRPTETEVRRLLFVLDPTHGVQTFVLDLLPGLMRELSRRTPRQTVELQGHVRGRPDWPATVRRRAANNDPTLFVCRQPKHRYDTPENQLLQHTIDWLHHTVSGAPEAVRAGRVALPDGTARPTAALLGPVEHALRRARSHQALRELTPAAPAPEHVRAAARSRQEGYRALARLHAACVEVVLDAREPLPELLRRVLVIPVAAPGFAPWSVLLFDALAGLGRHQRAEVGP